MTIGRFGNDRSTMNLKTATSAAAKIAASFLTIAAAVAIGGSATNAAPTPPPKLIKLPNGDYTVPMSELEGSGVQGKAIFHPEGPKTLVTVFAYGPDRHKHFFDLHPGSSCSQLGVSGARNLSPAMTGEPSQTLVALPITSITSNYVIAAQNATRNDQVHEACGHF
jgi:hypothetical protein